MRGIGSLTVVHNDIGASAGERDGDRGSYASTSASYESNSILEVVHAVIVDARQDFQSYAGVLNGDGQVQVRAAPQDPDEGLSTRRVRNNRSGAGELVTSHN
jgi:hypothetical protein